MTSNDGTCAYVARKDEPETWHGDDPDEWGLDSPLHPDPERETCECPHDALTEAGLEYCVFHTDPEDIPDEVDEGTELLRAIAATEDLESERTPYKQTEFIGATSAAFLLRTPRSKP